ncbi:hypothetical protein [Schlesneria paludicola]|uniref:hypothetical protein n=1 Tax=Schlesneria paludicola TaxID=360056 RepID=UPI00029A8DC3|nr:hypothetical protein [Schlesneria paludicola]
MIVKLLRDAQTRMRSWWLHDRIRVSPLEGKLLRVQAGDLVQVGQAQAEVVERSVIDNPDGCTLSLACRTSSDQTPSGDALLQIELTPEGDISAILWKENDRWRELSSIEVEIWLRS